MSKNKICVYAICKNEIKFVKNWLDNMSEADYIVVLDTGSTDGTYEILKEDKRVTKVIQKEIKPWRFDVARNESMKLVPDEANILVCTDFDELFNPGWAKILKKGWDDTKFNRARYNYAWSHNAIGEPTDIFKYDKIHTRDFHWIFPVHEVLSQKDESINVKFIDFENNIFLQHYPDRAKERKYYFDLLKLAVKENPTESHVKMLLAREYLIASNYDDALREYLEALEMPDIKEPDKQLVLLESLGRCADIYKVKKEYDTAIKYCQKFIKEDYTYREPYLIMAEIYNELDMPTLAEGCIEQCLKYSIRKNTWVERAATWIEWPNDILSISYYKLNNLDSAIANILEALKHNPDDPRLLKNYSGFLTAKLLELEAKEKNQNNK